MDIQFADDTEPFRWRNYGVFGFLADVRNYSDVTPIARPRGFPKDASPRARERYEEWDCDAHTPSWVLVSELSDFDYDAQMEDRRITVNGDGGCTTKPGGGAMTTWRAFLGSHFFDDLTKLQESGAERVVFWFDN